MIYEPKSVIYVAPAGEVVLCEVVTIWWDAAPHAAHVLMGWLGEVNHFSFQDPEVMADDFR